MSAQGGLTTSCVVMSIPSCMTPRPSGRRPLAVSLYLPHSHLPRLAMSSSASLSFSRRCRALAATLHVPRLDRRLCMSPTGCSREVTHHSIPGLRKTGMDWVTDSLSACMSTGRTYSVRVYA